MRNILIFLFLITLCIQITYAQNMQAYYKVINEAELSIVNGDYGRALIFYQHVLPNSQKSFIKDFYNAALCAILIKNNKLALRYTKELLQKGLPIDSIETNKYFQPILAFAEWEKIKNQYSLIREKYDSHINKPLRDTLHMLFKRDQYFRRINGSYKVYGDTIHKIDVENDRILKVIIKRYGYPNESLIGIDNDINLVKGFEFVIWHQTTLNHISDYQEILREAVKKGNVLPSRAAEIIENHIGQEIYYIHFFYRCACDNGCSDSLTSAIKNKLFFSSIPLAKKNQFNKVRQEIYLESLDDYNKKILFNLRDKRFKFLLNAAIPTFSFASEENLLEFIKPMKSISE